MNLIAHKNIVLTLNRNWQVIGIQNVKSAIGQLAADAATALDISEGNMRPVKWEEWINLPVREQDDGIGTPSRQIRVPRVIIAVNYDKVPKRRPKLNMRNLRREYNDTCAYTGRKLSPAEMSREHVIPASKGGKTDWTNVVLADRKINSRRGNRDLKEAKLSLLIEPRVPTERMPHEDILSVLFPEWRFFLPKERL